MWLVPCKKAGCQLVVQQSHLLGIRPRLTSVLYGVLGHFWLLQRALLATDAQGVAVEGGALGFTWVQIPGSGPVSFSNPVSCDVAVTVA